MLRCYSVIRTILGLGPIEYYRQKLKLPLVKLVFKIANLYKQRTKAGLINLRDLLFKGSVIALATSVLVWLSILMYLAFYYAYIPSISHEKPVHFQFKPCEDKKEICSFPNAHVELTKRQQLLMLGQLYSVNLELEIPESPANKKLGMFMVCADFRGKSGTIADSICRSSMMHYRSDLIDYMYKILFSPFYIFGNTEEKQKLKVELFTEYEEHEHEPVTDIYVEIQTKYIEIYSAKFCIHANFSGLRYIMFHFPLMSAAIGITCNLFFIALVCIISWYQLINTEEYQNYLESFIIEEHGENIVFQEDSLASSFEEPDYYYLGDESENNLLEERSSIEKVHLQ